MLRILNAAVFGIYAAPGIEKALRNPEGFVHPNASSDYASTSLTTWP